MTHRFIAAVRTRERQRAGLRGIYRAGRFWPAAGTVVASGDLGDADWKRLMDEPLLHIREATAEEIEAAAAGASETTTPETVIDELMRVIPGLGAGDFTEGGLPKLKPLRKAATEADDALITDAARDAAMARLVEGGFKVPKEQ